MIKLKPLPEISETCHCGGRLEVQGLLWQGMHTCYSFKCSSCSAAKLSSLPVSQAILERYELDLAAGDLLDEAGNKVKSNWYSSKLKNVLKPETEEVDLKIKVLKKYDKVLILNTLDYIYGHSLLILFNLQRIIESETSLGIVLLVQPMMEWLVPPDKVAEVWTVNLSFKDLNNFYPDLSEKINKELDRFEEVYLSRAYVIPTNQNIKIESFTGIKSFNFREPHYNPRITFIWREDPGRLWIRNVFLLKAFKVSGLSRLILPVQYMRVRLLFSSLRRKLKRAIRFTVAGLGRSYKFPEYIDDMRVTSFDQETERQLCTIYSESILVIGVHGSSMILPSGHSGMVISLMPSKRWGNFAEDILYVENDPRLSAFQRRILPLNLNLRDLADIATDMITGREYFLKKFLHGNELREK